jgi:hypothetical protein
MIEQERELPYSILPPIFNRPAPKLETFVGVKIVANDAGRCKIYTEEGEIDSLDLFGWLVGKEAYTMLESRGEFDSIFRFLPQSNLVQLATYGYTTLSNGIYITVYGRDGLLLVREGRNWGRLANIISLKPIEDITDLSPAIFAKIAKLATVRLQNQGFPWVNVRTVGQTAQAMVSIGSRFQERPKGVDLYRFLQSFKASRMEGVVFGRSEAYDYDITSAFPSLTSDLLSTNGISWIREDRIVNEAFYGAAKCDVEISPRLVRGPIAVRCGQKAVYFPVGLLSGVWLNKPDIDLLREIPEIGRITKVHEASWGVPKTSARPFKRLFTRMFNIRQSDPFLSVYMKLVMAAVWGKFISIYPIVYPDGTKATQSSPLFNPVFASHVTSDMRCRLYRKSLGQQVIGEFVDGLATTGPLTETKGFGGFVEQGRGQLVLFSDQFKGSSWKGEDILSYADQQRDQTHLDLPFSFRNSLSSAYSRFGPSSFKYEIGSIVEGMSKVKLGSSMRFLDQNIRVGDLLEDSYPSYPPRFSDLRGLKFIRGMSRGELPEMPSGYLSESGF